MSDEVGAAGLEGGEFRLPLTEVGEEGADGGAEIAERLVVGVPERLLLEEPPQRPAAGLVDTEMRFFDRIGGPHAATSIQSGVQS